jgi:hypothetical protein
MHVATGCKRWRKESNAKFNAETATVVVMVVVAFAFG